jgi:hypothetical protein
MIGLQKFGKGDLRTNKEFETHIGLAQVVRVLATFQLGLRFKFSQVQTIFLGQSIGET